MMDEDRGKISDGFHTFDELYEHRAALFISLMKAFPEISWYAPRHTDGTMFDGMFIAGMNLPTGQITYHLNVNPHYTNMRYSQVPFMPRSPEWDGHSSNDVISRLIMCDMSELRKIREIRFHQDWRK